MQNISILIVEANYIFRYINSRFLETASIQIHQIEKIEEASELVSKIYFNMILLDHSPENFDELLQEKITIKQSSVNKKMIFGWQYTYLTERQLEQLSYDNHLMISKPLTSDRVYKVWKTGMESM